MRDYLALEEIPAEWDTTGRGQAGREDQPPGRQPTEEEITTILGPWRPPRWREAALRIWKDRFDEDIWLRTYYGEDSDAAFEEWREAHEDSDPAFDEGTTPWCVLDDAAVFDLGERWDGVLDVLPELAGPTEGYRRATGFHSAEEVEQLRATIQAAGDREAEAETGAGMELQLDAVATFLVVADREAWDTGKLRLLYLDAQGNIVRHSRISPEDVFNTRHEWIGKKFRDGYWWREEFEQSGLDATKRLRFEPGGTLGDQYRAHGALGRALYGL